MSVERFIRHQEIGIDMIRHARELQRIYDRAAREERLRTMVGQYFAKLNADERYWR